MTWETLGGSGEGKFAMVWLRRMSCSWATGSEGEMDFAAKRQRRARRYFSKKHMLAKLYLKNILLYLDSLLTSSKKNLKSHLLGLDILGAEL